MHKDRYVFARLASFLDLSKFNRIVSKYDGDKYIKEYTCWNQLLTMMFCQLSGRESLRDLVVAMEAYCGKLYHLGIGKSVTRSNLAKANEGRDYHIFEEFPPSRLSRFDQVRWHSAWRQFSCHMIEQARTKRTTDISRLGGSIYAFDSTTISGIE